jgi:hypothetical protein
MTSLSAKDREDALRRIGTVCAFRVQGLSEDEVAARAGFEGVEHMRWQLEQWCFPDWFVRDSVPATQQKVHHRSGRKPGPGTGECQQLPSPHRAVDLLRERIAFLSTEVENLYNEHRYQDKRFAGAVMSPGTAIFSRYVEDKEGVVVRISL